MFENDDRKLVKTKPESWFQLINISSGVPLYLTFPDAKTNDIDVLQMYILNEDKAIVELAKKNK